MISAVQSPAIGGPLSSRPTRAASPTTEITNRPLPSHFDILGPLHDLLNKLNPLTFGADSANVIHREDGGAGGGGSTGNRMGVNRSALELTQLATAASDLKIRLTRARDVIAALSDMERTAEEQEEEILSLELSLAEARERVSTLRAAAAAVLTVSEQPDEDMPLAS